MKTLVLLFALVLMSSTAMAQTVEEEAEWSAEDPRRAEVEPLAEPPAELWLSLVGSIGLEEDQSRVAGMILLGGKFDVGMKSREVRVAGQNAKRTKRQDGELATEEEPKVDAAAPAIVRSTKVVPARSKLARGLVGAALRAAGSRAVADRLTDVALRARMSGLVPELRVRVAHVVDEDQSLAPTEYDPERITASGGTSLWMEGRATFRLDRLVFADDEVAIERLRADRAKLERDLVEDVLRAFEAWQRAVATLEDPLAEPLARDQADVDAAVAEARLDALTDGWFSTEAAKTRPSNEVVGQDDADGV